MATMAGLAVLFAWSRPATPATAVPVPDLFQLLPSTDLSFRRIDVRPGGVLVAVRHPHLLGHLADALRHAGDRDVVVMTVRMDSVAEGDGEQVDLHPTPVERELFANVVALSERLGHAVRLLIVPARNVFEAVVSTVIRLRTAEVYVGESATLSAAAQARLLGDAWEHAEGTQLAQGAARHPPRHGPQRFVLPRRARAGPDAARRRPHSPALAGCGRLRRPARSSSRSAQSGPGLYVTNN